MWHTPPPCLDSIHTVGNLLCSNKDMIPHQPPIWQQVHGSGIESRSLPWRALSIAATKLLAAASEPLILSGVLAMLRPRLSSRIIFYLHVCAELNYDSAPQQEASAACLLSMQLVLLSCVTTSINETLPVTISTLLHPPSSSLTPCSPTN